MNLCHHCLEYKVKGKGKTCVSCAGRLRAKSNQWENKRRLEALEQKKIKPNPDFYNHVKEMFWWKSVHKIN